MWKRLLHIPLQKRGASGSTTTLFFWTEIRQNTCYILVSLVALHFPLDNEVTWQSRYLNNNFHFCCQKRNTNLTYTLHILTTQQMNSSNKQYSVTMKHTLHCTALRFVNIRKVILCIFHTHVKINSLLQSIWKLLYCQVGYNIYSIVSFVLFKYFGHALHKKMPCVGQEICKPIYIYIHLT